MARRSGSLIRILGTMRLSVVLLLAFALLLSPACDKVSPVAPAGTTITLSVNPTRINIDGEATVTAIVRRENGSPVNPGTIVNFSTSLGRLSSNEAPTNDGGVAEVMLSGAGQIGTATVSASTGAAAAASTEIQIGSLASSITLQTSPTTIGKSGGEVDLLAVVRDDAGQLLSNLAVNFSTTAGILASGGAPLLTTERGEARDTLNVTELDIVALDSGSITVTVSGATAEGASLLETSRDIGVRGLISFISLQVTPGSVAATGGVLDVLALVKDDVGLGVAGAPVNFNTESGSLGSGGAVITADSQGQARDTLTVTAADVDALGGRVFNVRAETVDFSGSTLEAVFQVRVQTGAPIADFSFSVQPDGRTVNFFNSSTGDPVLNYSWNFGDNCQTPCSTETNPTHQYTTGPGTYTVTLTVTNDIGTDSIQKQVPITN